MATSKKPIAALLKKPAAAAKKVGRVTKADAEAAKVAIKVAPTPALDKVLKLLVAKKPAPAKKAVAAVDPLMAEMEADKSAMSSGRAAKAALDRIQALVSAAGRIQVKLAAAEDEVRRLKAEAFRINSEDLPELLRESGLEEVTLADGTKVAIKDEFSCGLSEERTPEGLKWLRDHELGSIIKTAVIATFGKDELARADALFAQLLKKRPAETLDLKEAVHPATLKATLKDLMERDVKFPLKLFGYMPYAWAKVTAPKAAKR